MRDAPVTGTTLSPARLATEQLSFIKTQDVHGSVHLDTTARILTFTNTITQITGG